MRKNKFIILLCLAVVLAGLSAIFPLYIINPADSYSTYQERELLNNGNESEPPGNIAVSEKAAVDIANGKAKELRYDPSDKKIRATFHTKPWNSCILKGATNKTSLAIRDKLTGKKYWFIYYSHKNLNVYGGDMCIFVDADSSEVIAHVMWK